MKCILPSQMQQMEQAFISNTGFSSLLLMEQAAHAAYNRIINCINKQYGVLLICGKGNNGGDGYALARLLTNAGINCYIFAPLGPPTSNEALYNFNLLKKLYPNINISFSNFNIDNYKNTSFVVDALFGTGFNSGISEEIQSIITSINESQKFICALDVPSGLNASTGYVQSCAIRANITLCFHRPKDGLLLSQAVYYTGKLSIVDIGIPNEFDNCEGSVYIDQNYFDSNISKTADNDHKGKNGKILVVAGASEMAGAGILCASAALKSGAGLVSLACNSHVMQVAQSINPSIIGLSLENEELGTIDSLLNKLSEYNVLLIGPGLKDSDFTNKLVISILQKATKLNIPSVVDAQALNVLAKHHCMLNENMIITPHPKEAARLLDCDIDTVLQNYKQTASLLNKKYGACVLLKGARSLILNSQNSAINSIGTAALAKGGSGDVLCGIIAANMVKNNAFVAGAISSYALCQSASLAQKSLGIKGVLSSDVIEFLAHVL